MSFCPRTPKLGFPTFSKLGLAHLWRPITSSTNLRLRWSLKKSCSPCWELSNNMSHATCMQINWGDSWLLVVESQIGNLIPSHFLAITYVLNIQMDHANPFKTSRFQKLSNDIRNFSIQWFLTPLIALWRFKSPLGPKVGVHLGVWGFISSHSPTFSRAWNVILGLHFWPPPL
jgi:hypothetical protein